MSDWLNFEDIELAYNDFLKHKKTKDSAYSYMQIATRDLPKLLDELNNRTYEISASVAFCVTRPKLREVFAASPRDRVVHHLLILYFYAMFEKYSIANSFNCRNGKGNSAMSDFVHKSIHFVGKDGWVAKLDVKGCFMSIDKDILWRKLEPAIRKYCLEHDYMSEHVENWVWLWKKIVYNRPETNCVIHGNPHLFDLLPANKTLFKSNGKGLAIGNLTSQILANFYFSELDHTITKYMNKSRGFYGRYMDDMFLASPSKANILKSIPLVKIELAKLAMELSPSKIYIQHAMMSVNIVGMVHCYDRLYVSNRTMGNVYDLWGKFSNYDDDYCRANIERIVSQVNSYFGFCRYGNTNKVRQKMWETLPSNIKKYTYCVNNKFVKVIQKYKTRNQFRKELSKKYNQGFMIEDSGQS